MDEHIHVHISMVFKSMFTISFFLLTTLPLYQSQQPPKTNHHYLICKEQSYNCKNLFNISYPFWGHNRPSYCGGGDLFNLNCQKHDNKNTTNTTTIRIGSQNFTVLEINPHNYTMRMVRTDLAHNVCSPLQLEDTYLSPNAYKYPKSVYTVTIFYNCSSLNFSFPYFNFTFTCGHESGLYLEGVKDGMLKEHPECEIPIQVPSDAPLEYYVGGGLNALQQVLHKGFEVNYVVAPECKRCMGSGGLCGTNDTVPHQFSCHCPNGSYALECPVSHHKHQSNALVTTVASNHWTWLRKVIIGVTTATVAGVLIGITIFCFRCKSSIWEGNFLLTRKSNQDIEAFLRNHGAQTLKRYKFSDVKIMTNSFKVKLGQGGFGAVYKGKLLTGCLVAVKVLNPSKGNIEDFINEVASISRTSHVNVVTLLGFCLEGHKKALIYEFMPNGSLDKFIYTKEPETNAPLSWDILYQIVIGIARGLEYLHRGCNTRILHFDIKPHNILLDENFCPKISDFGLAKLCPRKDSIISMSDARGTMGFIAPEVWNRHFGGVSHKSDVYSYGMMLLEMVGGRKNFNAEASHTSEIYFPHWAYKRLELGADLRSDDEVMSIEEKEIAKKMIVVGLWCIQTIPNDRPTMRTVIDMLEGNMNSLEMPPKPFLSSPTRSGAESSMSLN